MQFLLGLRRPEDQLHVTVRRCIRGEKPIERPSKEMQRDVAQRAFLKRYDDFDPPHE
jgi:hypothetical protein